LDLRAAELGGSPEAVDLFEQAAPGFALLAARRSRVVQRLELRAHPNDRGGHRPAPGLGGMSGEHRLDHEIRQQLAKPVLTVLGADRRHRLGQRFRLRLASAVALAKSPRAVPLFGEVDELEVAGERSRNVPGALDRPRGDKLRRAALAFVALTRIDHGAAKQLDVAQQLRAAGFREDLPQHVAEQAHFPAQRCRHLRAGGLARHDSGHCRARRFALRGGLFAPPVWLS
jgi:hypothetical protein